MKKILKFKIMGALSLVSVVVVGILLTAVGSAAAGFYLAPGTQTVTTGSNFNVAIRVNSTGSVDTVQVHITFPSDKLQQVGSVSFAGSPLDAHASVSTSAGDISFVAYTTGTAPTGDTLIATVSFAPIATGTANISFASDTAAASSGSDVTGSKAGGTYTIQAPTPAPNPNPSGGTTTPTSGSSSSSKPNSTATTPSRSGTAPSGTTSSPSSTTPTTTGTGAVVSVNGTTASQVPASGQSTKQSNSKKYWIVGSIVAIALIGGVVGALVIIRKRGSQGFTSKSNKAFDTDIYSTGPAVASKPSFVSDDLANGEKASSSREDRLGKVQGEPVHKPGETVEPTQVHSQGGQDE
jgi:hypothetical protein